ncbi:MAG TPA: BamA/TamA family outer membrane protein [Gemmatimonadales bacterium]
MTSPVGSRRLLAGMLVVVSCSLQAQGRAQRVVAGPHYAAGGLHRWLFGSRYRDLWTTPIDVATLDMSRVSGGLTPTTAGGGFQTKSLRFRGADGVLYGFRSVDKDPALLPPELQGTFIEDLVQDQTSSAFPSAPAVVAALLEAADVLHTEPRLVVLPDDPRLVEFRERFAGTLGFFEARAIVEPGAQSFAGADEILDSDELYPRIARSPADRIDARRFLAARLMDLLVGDWDRHRGQWGWTRFGNDRVTYWVPIPEDRDQAFVQFDGLMLSVVRITAPQFVRFGPDYPDMVGLTWNGRESDRWFLAELPKPVRDSVASALQSRLTDAVIDDAVGRMPAEYEAIGGAELRAALRSRRDHLAEAAETFYRLLAAEVDIRATDESERITLDRHPDGRLEVRIATAGAPYFHRTFDPDETSEVRVLLGAGDDRVIVRGPGDGIAIKIVGGGSDVVTDSSAAGKVRFFATGSDRVAGPGVVRIDRRPYTPPPKRFEEELPPRDWGARWHPAVWASSGPDVGVFLGGGVSVRRYGFRRLPYAWSLRLRGGAATGAQTFRADVLSTFYRTNSRTRGQIYARASGIEILRYYGLGNESVERTPDRFHRVTQEQYTLAPSLTFGLPGTAELTVGPRLTLSRTAASVDRILGTPTYGDGDFAQLALGADVEFDTRDVPAAPRRGVHVRVGGSVIPQIYDVAETFGEVHGVASTYVTAGGGTQQATLALRAGGKKVWGVFPFAGAAFIGDAESVRLGRQNRFGGEASAFGSAELRLRLARVFLLVPTHVGVLGLADAGRVFASGETSRTWHSAFGGGIWLSVISASNTVSLTVARGDTRRTAAYLGAGFAY